MISTAEGRLQLDIGYTKTFTHLIPNGRKDLKSRMKLPIDYIR